MAKKAGNWQCNKEPRSGNIVAECFNDKLQLGVSMSKDGSIRFSKFQCDEEVRIDGKLQKNKCGVEIK